MENRRKGEDLGIALCITQAVASIAAILIVAIENLGRECLLQKFLETFVVLSCNTIRTASYAVCVLIHTFRVISSSLNVLVFDLFVLQPKHLVP